MLEVEGIYCKLEYLNPSGSIKARIAKYMIERAEDEGLLKTGRYHRRGHVGQHGQRPLDGRRGQGLQHARRDARGDERRAGRHQPRVRGRGDGGRPLPRQRGPGESKGARAGARLLLPGPVRERVERGGEQDLAGAGDTGPAPRWRRPRRDRDGRRDRGDPDRGRPGLPRGEPCTSSSSPWNPRSLRPSCAARWGTT